MKSFKEWLEEAIMDPMTALKIFGLSEFPKTAIELRQLHKKLALTNHPDRGGSLEKMQDINAANDVLKQWIGKSVKTVAGASAGTGSMRGNAQAYRQAGQTFKTSRAARDANRETFRQDILKTRGPIYEAILKCLKKIDFFGCVSHLTNFFGEPFTHIEKASTVADVINMKSYWKETWVSHLFVNKSQTIVFEVALTGDSDHMAWLMRHHPNGFNNSKTFDFEWAIAVNAYIGKAAQKKIISRTVKYRRADLTKILRDATKIFPVTKLKKFKS